MRLRKEKKTITLFGRAIPLTLIVALVLVGIGSAALIANFFVVDTKITAVRAISPESSSISCDPDIPEDWIGATCVKIITINNDAGSPVLMELGTEKDPALTVVYSVNGAELPLVDADTKEELVIQPGGTDLTIAIHKADAIEPLEYTITTTAEIPDNIKLLVLDNKDSTTWQRISDDMDGYVIYTPTGATFNYFVSAKDLSAITGYSLIYYADKPDRFVNWGGDNPGKLIGTGTTYSDGTLRMEADAGIGGNLPRGLDANIAENFYGGEPDYYLNSHGAKLWLVPSSDYTEPALTAWNPTTYLFETDLISYTETAP